MLINKNDIIYILDGIASTLLAIYLTNKLSANLRSMKLLTITFKLKAYNYLSIKWDYKTRYSYFKNTFLLLVMIYKVITYVKARAIERCLVQKLYSESKFKL